MEGETVSGHSMAGKTGATGAGIGPRGGELRPWSSSLNPYRRRDPEFSHFSYFPKTKTEKQNRAKYIISKKTGAAGARLSPDLRCWDRN